MVLTKKRLETLGGIGSILTGLMCVGIGVMDYETGNAWKIWVIMTVVLVVNGIAMIRHAAKRPEDEIIRVPSPREVAKART
jgi:hypothetical protein